MKRLAFGVLAFLFASCTHFIIDTETRIQVLNITDEKICNLSLISKNENIKVLVKDTVEAGERSKSYGYELTGKFDFVIYVGGSYEKLGTHELKGGSVEAQITKEGDVLKMNLKN